MWRFTDENSLLELEFCCDFEKQKLKVSKNSVPLNSPHPPFVWMKLKHSVKTQAAQAHDARS